MLYNQPYGISDPNAPYINGNPSTGTMGSIPPAPSIEHPQREIVNFITKSGFVPAATDLFQLAKAVQSGLVNWGVDQGSPNDIQITPVVPVSQYTVGLCFVIKVAYGNTSHVTVNVNGIGKAPLIHTDQTPLLSYELRAGQLIEVAYDGTNWQAIGGVSGGAVIQSQPTHLYVNANIGDDTLYDGTSATIGAGSIGPFKSARKALTQMAKYNLGGWPFYIHFADGVYTDNNPLYFPLPNGSGRVYLIGNVTNPSAVSIFNTGTGSAWVGVDGGTFNIQGFSFRTTTSHPGDGGNSLWFGGANQLEVGKCDFAFCPSTGNHICIGPAGTIYLVDDISVSGPAATFMTAQYNAIGYSGKLPPANLTITTPITYNQFAYAVSGAQCQLQFTTINGFGNVSGSKYLAVGNGVINVQGRGTSYLPGTTPGNLASGGQYI
jgi:hypothetical protein